MHLARPDCCTYARVRQAGDRSPSRAPGALEHATGVEGDARGYNPWPTMMAASPQRPEIALLCACVSRNPSAPTPDPTTPIDWNAFLSIADAHSVAARLAQPLRRLRPDVPPSVVERVERRFIQVTSEHLSRLSQLTAILARLDAHGVEALTFKGPAMAADLFGHVGLRSSADIDLLVRPGSAATVRHLLLTDGYTVPPRRRHRCGSLLHGLYRGAGRDDTYLPPKPAMAAVDVHVAFAFWMQGVRLDLDGVFQRAVTVDVAGRRFPTPHPDDLVLILAIHGMMHGWSSLRAVSDVDAVAARVDDWAAVLHRADRARMRRILLVALLLARGILGTTLPPPILAHAERDRHAVDLAERSAAELFDRSRAAEFDPGLWQASFLDGRLDRCQFHTRRVIYEWFLKWPWDEWLGRRRGATADDA